MKLFTFVILHYNTLNDTVECVDSILNNVNYNNYKIIIVDNASPNGSGEKLSQLYKNHTMIKITISKENMGFANGNNIGYRIAKSEYNSDFIILLNNDTKILQEDFLSKINYKYSKVKFDILGPDIISLKDGGHQNPQRKKVMSETELKNIINATRLRLFLNYLNIEKLIKVILIRLNLIDTPTDFVPDFEEKEIENIQLHGCCLIFSQNYIEKCEGLFSGTFMYLEEDILFFIAKKHNMRTLYYPKIKIYHKEDSSTENTFNTDSSKRRFKYINVLKSAKAFRKIMSEN